MLLEKLKGRNYIFKDIDPLTDIEIKLLILIVSRIKPDDDLEKTSYTFTYSELKVFLNLKEENLQKQLMKISENLITKIFEITDGDDLVIQLKWVISAHYNPNKKSVSFSLLPEIRELLLLLQSKTKILKNYEEYESKYGKVKLNIKAIGSK